jgi:acid stress-induced BolA-like protein IbaG/YrbA
MNGPINSSEISRMLNDALPGAQIVVRGEGGKFEVEVVSPGFEGLNRVKRQQAVYRILNEHISTGAIHAVSMILKSPAETA